MTTKPLREISREHFVLYLQPKNIFMFKNILVSNVSGHAIDYKAEYRQLQLFKSIEMKNVLQETQNIFYIFNSYFEFQKRILHFFLVQVTIIIFIQYKILTFSQIVKILRKMSGVIMYMLIDNSNCKELYYNKSSIFHFHLAFIYFYPLMEHFKQL